MTRSLPKERAALVRASLPARPVVGDAGSMLAFVEGLLAEDDIKTCCESTLLWLKSEGAIDKGAVAVVDAERVFVAGVVGVGVDGALVDALVGAARDKDGALGKALAAAAPLRLQRRR